MKVLWAKSPQRSKEIMEALAPVSSWHPNTVKTLLTRLVNKKAVNAKSERNHYLFSPAVSQADLVADESAEFLARVFDGDLKRLQSHFKGVGKEAPAPAAAKPAAKAAPAKPAAPAKAVAPAKKKKAAR